MRFDAEISYGDETDLKSGYKQEIRTKFEANMQFSTILLKIVRKYRLSLSLIIR
jgi:hypothetical protein